VGKANAEPTIMALLAEWDPVGSTFASPAGLIAAGVSGGLRSAPLANPIPSCNHVQKRNNPNGESLHYRSLKLE